MTLYLDRYVHTYVVTPYLDIAVNWCRHCAGLSRQNMTPWRQFQATYHEFQTYLSLFWDIISARCLFIMMLRFLLIFACLIMSLRKALRTGIEHKSNDFAGYIKVSFSLLANDFWWTVSRMSLNSVQAPTDDNSVLDIWCFSFWFIELLLICEYMRRVYANRHRN